MTMLASILAASLFGVTPVLGLENTNIVSYDEEQRVADYNRLRLDLALTHPEYSKFSVKLIIDNETRYVEKPRDLINKTIIYRGYLQYSGETHLWTIGRQRIPFGVGRIWNPIDVFDPIDFQAKETDERHGTEAIHYEYAISSLANLDLTGAKGQMAARLKGYLEVADMALVAVWDDENKRDIIGWEIAGEIAETGLEVRSEGGSFYDRLRHERYCEFIVGAEYGFANSLTILGEYKYNDDTHINYGAALFSYQFSMLWSAQVMGIVNLDDHGRFISPTFNYSAADEITVSGGALFYDGDEEDEFGTQADQVFFRLFIHF